MDDYVRRVDQGVARLGSEEFALGMLTGRVPGTDLVNASELWAPFGRALQATYVYGMFAGLPLEEQLFPPMQQRIRQHVGHLGESLVELSAGLARVPRATLATVQRALPKDLEFARVIEERIDHELRELHLPRLVARRLRLTAQDVLYRVRAQSLDTVLGEYTDKMDRLAASTAGGRSLDRMLEERIGDEAAFRRQERMRAAVAHWQAQGVAAEDAAWQQTATSNGTYTGLGVAGLLLGLGGTAGLISLAVAAPSVLICLCISIPLILVTAFLLIGGSVLIARGASGI